MYEKSYKIVVECNEGEFIENLHRIKPPLLFFAKRVRYVLHEKDDWEEYFGDNYHEELREALNRQLEVFRLQVRNSPDWVPDRTAVFIGEDKVTIRLDDYWGLVWVPLLIVRYAFLHKDVLYYLEMAIPYHLERDGEAETRVDVRVREPRWWGYRDKWIKGVRIKVPRYKWVPPAEEEYLIPIPEETTIVRGDVKTPERGR